MIPFALHGEGAGHAGIGSNSGSLFSYVDLESRVPPKHPLRVIKAIVDDALRALDAEFEKLYEGTGRQSIAPERLLRASLLQAFYSVRSERQLMEQLDYNLLFRWFVGLGLDDPVWDHSTFSKNRDRLLDADVAAKFLEAVLRHGQVKRFLSDDHFSVDGTLVEAWASLKSFRARDASDEPPAPGRNGERDFHGEKRSNDTHASTTDPDAKLYRKSAHTAAKLCFIGHALMENRSGLVVKADATTASNRVSRQDPPLRHRRSHHTTCELRHKPAQTQVGGRGVRLGQDHCRDGQGQGARPAARALPLHLRDGRLQSHTDAQASGGSLKLGPPSQPSGRLSNRTEKGPARKCDPIVSPSSTAC